MYCHGIECSSPCTGIHVSIEVRSMLNVQVLYQRPSDHLENFGVRSRLGRGEIRNKNVPHTAVRPLLDAVANEDRVARPHERVVDAETVQRLDAQGLELAEQAAPERRRATCCDPQLMFTRVRGRPLTEQRWLGQLQQVLRLTATGCRVTTDHSTYITLPMRRKRRRCRPVPSQSCLASP